jgi:hypothetical protein
MFGLLGADSWGGAQAKGSAESASKTAETAEYVIVLRDLPAAGQFLCGPQRILN